MQSATLKFYICYYFKINVFMRLPSVKPENGQNVSYV